jgi:SAM-dependent methyltransferase
MEEPLSFLEDNSFDGILSALAITYVFDHGALFGEFRRVLRTGGWFVFSTEHPFFSYQYFGIENYFESREVSCDWTGFGIRVRMPGYYHTSGLHKRSAAGKRLCSRDHIGAEADRGVSRGAS